MRVRVLNTSDRRIAADARALARTLGAGPLRISNWQFPIGDFPVVNVVLVSDRSIAELNRRYLKRNRPTDVLSFRLDLAEPACTEEKPQMNADEHRCGRQGNRKSKIESRKPKTERLLGEVYVSRDRARVQAREHGLSYHEEVRRLVLHGMLHLLGLSHRQMEVWHKRCL